MRTRIAGLVVVLAGMALLAAPVQAATITVSTTADESPIVANGNCTLREAVNASNTNAVVDSCTAGTVGPDTITLSAGSFALSGAANDDLNVSGDLDLKTSSGAGPLTIDGAGMTSTTIAAGATQDRVIHNVPSTGGAAPLLSLEDLTVSGGGGAALNSGGGIYSQGSSAFGVLNLTRVQVRDNQALNGAGLNAIGALNVTDSLIGPNNDTPSASGGGGGIASSAELTMIGSEVFENSAISGGGGIRLNSGSDGGSLIQDSVIRDNTTSVNPGGGISSGSGTGSLTIEDSRISGNQALSTFGGGINYAPDTAKTLTIRGSELRDNSATAFGGGGLDLDTTTATAVIEDSVFADNRVEPGSAGSVGGGAITARGALDIRDSSFTGNRITTAVANVSSLGAVLRLQGGATSTIRRSLFTQNTAPGVSSARGLFFVGDNAATKLNIVNSTISGNTLPASPTQAAVIGGDTATTVNLANVTVTGNAPVATPIAFPGASAVSVHLKNSILDHGDAFGGCGEAVDDGGNVERGDTCAGFPALDSNVDPMLGPLADNGGATLSHKPATASPVVNRVTAANCTDQAAVPITEDQRGAPRPVGAGCETGAVELTDEKIVIGLSTVPSGLSNQFPFSSDIAANTSFSLADAGERVIDDPLAGTHTVTAADQAGFGTSVDCNDDGSPTPSTVAGRTATIELDFNETVRCDFVKTKNADPPPPPPAETLTVVLDAKPKLPANELRAKATCSVACTILASVKGKAGGDKFKSPKASSDIPAGVPTKVSVVLKRKVLKQVQGEKGGGTFTAIATAGNQTSVAKDPFKLK